MIARALAVAASLCLASVAAHAQQPSAQQAQQQKMAADAAKQKAAAQQAKAQADAAAAAKAAGEQAQAAAKAGQAANAQKQAQFQANVPKTTQMSEERKQLEPFTTMVENEIDAARKNLQSGIEKGSAATDKLADGLKPTTGTKSVGAAH